MKITAITPDPIEKNLYHVIVDGQVLRISTMGCPAEAVKTLLRG